MSGSLDDQRVEVVNVKTETLLTVLVYTDGRVRLGSSGTPAWISQTMRDIADAVDAGAVTGWERDEAEGAGS